MQGALTSFCRCVEGVGGESRGGVATRSTFAWIVGCWRADNYVGTLCFEGVRRIGNIFFVGEHGFRYAAVVRK